MQRFTPVRRLLTLLSLALAALAAPLPAVAKDGALHVALGPAPDTIDPHRAGSVYASAILRELYEGLATRGPDFAIIPGAAERWTVSDDGLVWTFTLREDGKWSDGTPVTAEDFVRSWRRAVDPATRPFFTNLLYAVENARAITAGTMPPESLGVEAVDARTFRVRLERPDPYLLVNTTHYGTYPVHGPSLAAHGDGFTKPGNLIGNGAYVLTEALAQTHFKMVRNPHFHDAANVAIPEVWFHVAEDQGTQVKRYRAGELHVTERIPQAQLDFLKRTLPEHVRIHPMVMTRFLQFNQTREPWGSNPKLRRALALAIDRDVLARALGGGETPAWGLIPAGLDGYVPARNPDQDMTQAERDAEARRLLAEAGYGPGGKPLKITLMHASVESIRQVAVMVSAMWRQKLGVETVLDNQEFRVTMARMRSRDYDVFLRGWRSLSPPYGVENFRTRDTGNNPGYADEAFEALMAKAETALDPEVSHDLLRQAELVLAEDTVAVPLFLDASRRLVSPRVEGWVPNLGEIHPVRFLRLKPEG